METEPVIWDWSNRFWLGVTVVGQPDIPSEVVVLEALVKPREVVAKGRFNHPSELLSVEQRDDAPVWWMLVRASTCRTPQCVLSRIHQVATLCSGKVIYIELEAPIGEGYWRYRYGDPHIHEGWLL